LQQHGGYLGYTGHAPNVLATAVTDVVLKKSTARCRRSLRSKILFSTHRPDSENRPALAGEQRPMKGPSCPLTDPLPIDILHGAAVVRAANISPE